MNIVDRIGRARAQHLTEHRRPARVWLAPDDWAEFWNDPMIYRHDRLATFMGMAIAEDRLTHCSRIVAEDGTAISLEVKSA